MFNRYVKMSSIDRTVNIYNQFKSKTSWKTSFIANTNLNGLVSYNERRNVYCANKIQWLFENNFASIPVCLV